jgi:hypothetical protein
MGKGKLLGVGEAGSLSRFLPRLSEYREQDSGKNCDNRDNN